MRFPAVTVCNVNPIRKSAYQFSTQLKQKLEERDNDTCFREGKCMNYYIYFQCYTWEISQFYHIMEDIYKEEFINILPLKLAFILAFDFWISTCMV
jgi:hypothetical protein